MNDSQFAALMLNIYAVSIAPKWLRDIGCIAWFVIAALEYFK